MRITFVLPETNLSGGNRVVAAYASELQARGHEVVVVSQPPRRFRLGEQVRSLMAGTGWLAHPKRPPSHLDDRGLDHRIIDRYRPITANDVPDADVVVATWWETAEWVLDYPASKGAKAYFLQHYEVFDWTPRARVEATWRAKALHKIVVAKWLAEKARDEYGDAHASLVPNSVDLAQFQAPPRDKQPIPTVGFMYVETPWKGVDIALKAMEIAKRSLPELKLAAFGEGPPTAALPLPPGSAYVVRPKQTELWRTYAACDAWLFASRLEGFGLPLLEAMACRTPVIATPAGAAPELMEAGGGILVRQQDPEDMARAIERVARLSPSEWRAWSDRAFRLANTYSLKDATTLMEAALARAVERTRAGELSAR